MTETIKKILDSNKNACVVVVENDKPVFVVISFEEYDRVFSRNPIGEQRQKSFFQDEKALEEVNREIINLGAPRDEISVEDDVREQDIRIIEESLPIQEIQEIKVEDIPL
jgi:PHD/YefM family antitoxin component YafN of YafNO toxin-antitoxin module